MNWIRQSTAANLRLGPFVDQADGFTAETGLSIAQADIRLSKMGGAFAQSGNAAGATHDENGYYLVPLDTADTDTPGRLRVAVSKAGARPVVMDLMVLTANVYDSLVPASDKLQVDVEEIGPAMIDAAAIATDAGTELANALLDQAAGVETGLTVRQALRVIAAALCGKLSGAAGTTVTIRNTADSKNRIVATVDASGNRSAVTLDGT